MTGREPKLENDLFFACSIHIPKLCRGGAVEGLMFYVIKSEMVIFMLP